MEKSDSQRVRSAMGKAEMGNDSKRIAYEKRVIKAFVYDWRCQGKFFVANTLKRELKKLHNARLNK